MEGGVAYGLCRCQPLGGEGDVLASLLGSTHGIQPTRDLVSRMTFLMLKLHDVESQTFLKMALFLFHINFLVRPLYLN